MKLLEAIIDANHRALRGDAAAGLHPEEFAEALPVAALTCIDVRLNPLVPEVLGIPEEQFIWLRNAGNIITGPLSSTVRSIAQACAVEGAREIMVIGHTDCRVCKASVMTLTERFRALGVERARLPENLAEFFGLFASEQQNLIKAADIIRQSPLIGPNIPVHGLLVDIRTGRLEWLVNGYQASVGAAISSGAPSASPLMEEPSGGWQMPVLAEFKPGEIKFPESQIGEYAQEAKSIIGDAREVVQSAASLADRIKEEFRPQIARMKEELQPKLKLDKPSAESKPPVIPLPPPIRPKPHFPPDDRRR